MSLVTLHVFLFTVFVVYTLNGAYPCQIEYWCINLYLPIGIGLFQTQNQQLLVVSSQQARLITNKHHFKPLPPKPKKEFGGISYWTFRFKCWWGNVRSTRRYKAYVTLSIIIQIKKENDYIRKNNAKKA